MRPVDPLPALIIVVCTLGAVGTVLGMRATLPEPDSQGPVPAAVAETQRFVLESASGLSDGDAMHVVRDTQTGRCYAALVRFNSAATLGEVPCAGSR